MLISFAARARHGKPSGISAVFRVSAELCGRRHASSAPTIDKKKYSHTLKLPTTTFPLRHKNQYDVDTKYRERTTIDLYQRQVSP
jgi:hypothetical protein